MPQNNVSKPAPITISACPVLITIMIDIDLHKLKCEQVEQFNNITCNNVHELFNFLYFNKWIVQ